MNGYVIARDDGTLMDWRESKVEADALLSAYNSVSHGGFYIRQMEYNDYLKEVWA